MTADWALPQTYLLLYDFRRLGNTPSVCKKCYIHPVILESYLDGTLIFALPKTAESEVRTALGRLNPEEAAVVALLQQRLKASKSKTLLQQLKQSVRANTGSKGRFNRRGGA